MAHYCICVKCNEKFDRDKIQAVIAGSRRYAHQTCLPDGELVPMPPPKENKKAKEETDLDKLKDYISTLFKEPNWAMITKELKKFTKELGFSYSGILKSLVYFYEVKNNDTEKANNHLGIVPFIYTDAYNYYYSLFMAQQANEDRTLETKTKEVTIRPPHKRGTKFRLFSLGEDTNEE